MALLARDTLITGPLPDGALLLETFHGVESLGRPYQYDLTMLSEDPSIPVDALLGQPLTVQITLDNGETRYFSGIVTRFAKTGLAMHHVRYTAVLRPKLALFDHARNCRVFNDPTNFDPDPEGKPATQDALKLVTEVLAERGLTELDSGSIKDHVYRDRRFCVQYRETDFDFVQRLLEEEGIYYFFEHADGKHTLVLADAVTAHKPAPGYESILYLPKRRRQAREEEHFWSLAVAKSLYPGFFSVVRGYDHTQARPKEILTEYAPAPEEQPGTSFEHYDYPGGLIDSARAREEATVRMQVEQVGNRAIEVEGNPMGVGVGQLVTLRRASADDDYEPFWSHAEFAKEYLVTSATYAITINQYETGEGLDADEPFKARFTLLDSQVQFRPPRTVEKPRIEGAQTAIVVGSEGDEIYTDGLGRVKVQFDWDRLGGRDQKSSCWIRVAEVWAGKQWGAVHLPRVGQEVVVKFLDGDPDRPIIIGRVYNADAMPPYALPENMTQSGLKSRSSKEGAADNFNELRFEDLKGKEELHIQAERDMTTLVKHDSSLSVKGDRSVSVGGNESVVIEGKGQSEVHSSVNVTGKHTLDASDTIKWQAPTSITLECGKSTIVLEPGKITLTAGGEASVVIDANVSTTAKGGGHTLHDANVFHVAKGGAQVLLDGNVALQAKGGAGILLDPNVAAASKPGSMVLLDGSATLHGETGATVKGAASAKLEAGGASVEAGPAGVTLSGTEVNVSAAGMATIMGAIVKIG